MNDPVSLIITKAKLEQHLDQVNESLLTYKEALILWKKQQAQQASLEDIDGYKY